MTSSRESGDVTDDWAQVSRCFPQRAASRGGHLRLQNSSGLVGHGTEHGRRRVMMAPVRQVGCLATGDGKFGGCMCLSDFPFMLPFGAAWLCNDVRAAAVEALGLFGSALRHCVFTAASEAALVGGASCGYVAVSATMVALSRAGAFAEHTLAEFEEGDLSREGLAREMEDNIAACVGATEDGNTGLDRADCMQAHVAVSERE